LNGESSLEANLNVKKHSLKQSIRLSYMVIYTQIKQYKIYNMQPFVNLCIHLSTLLYNRALHGM